MSLFLSIITNLVTSGAGPLAVVTASFVSTVFYQKQGWNIKKNAVVDFFAILWVGFEPLLFSTAGAQVKVKIGT